MKYLLRGAILLLLSTACTPDKVETVHSGGTENVTISESIVLPPVWRAIACIDGGEDVNPLERGAGAALLEACLNEDVAKYLGIEGVRIPRVHCLPMVNTGRARECPEKGRLAVPGEACNHAGEELISSCFCEGDWAFSTNPQGTLICDPSTNTWSECQACPSFEDHMQCVDNDWTESAAVEIVCECESEEPRGYVECRNSRWDPTSCYCPEEA